MKRLVAALAAVAVATGIAVVAMAPWEDDSDNPAQSGTPDPLAAPPGKRWVGVGQVVVAVPERWSTNDIGFCVGPSSPTVAFYGARGPAFSCPPWLSREKYHPSLRVTSAPIADMRIHRREGEREVVDGVVMWRDRTPVNSTFPWLAIPSLDLWFSVDYHQPRFSRAEANRILDSVRVLPDGYVAVPYDADTPTAERQRQLLHKAGLEVRTVYEQGEDPFPSGAILASRPPFGTPVRKGDTVTLVLALRSTLEGRCDPWAVGTTYGDVDNPAAKAPGRRAPWLTRSEAVAAAARSADDPEAARKAEAAAAKLSYQAALRAIGGGGDGQVDPERCVWLVTVRSPFTPGHGPSGDVRRTYRYYDVILDEATGTGLAVSAGRSVVDVTRTLR